MTLHLCAHLAYGQPTFDIAMRCEDMGTVSDPGPWWITTAGHRLRPYWTIPLDKLVGKAEMEGAFDSDPYTTLSEMVPPPPDDAEESWSIDDRSMSEVDREQSQNFLARLGLLKPKAPSKPMRRI